MSKKNEPNKFGAAMDFVRAAPTAPTSSRHPPPSDARLTVNIDRELHMRVKLYSVKNHVSIGELIEEWIEKHIPKE
jgi:predicted HicB family RNase H-like nuclease